MSSLTSAHTHTHTHTPPTKTHTKAHTHTRTHTHTTNTHKHTIWLADPGTLSSPHVWRTTRERKPSHQSSGVMHRDHDLWLCKVQVVGDPGEAASVKEWVVQLHVFTASCVCLRLSALITHSCELSVEADPWTLEQSPSLGALSVV